MRLTAHQPNYLPYGGFFQKITAADEFLIVDTTQFVKRGPFGWIHRNKIRTPNGPIWLTLPVLSKGRFDQKIHEVDAQHRNPALLLEEHTALGEERDDRLGPHQGDEGGVARRGGEQ